MAHVRACVAAEPTSLLELQPSVEWDRAQHSLMEADEPFYIQRATGVRGDVKVADDLYCGALTNPDGDIFCSGDLCAARIHPRHSPGRLEVLCAPIPHLLSRPQVQRWPRHRRQAGGQPLPGGQRRRRRPGHGAKHADRRQPTRERCAQRGEQHELRRGGGGGHPTVGRRLPTNLRRRG